MNQIHTIRIRGPWQRTVIEGALADSELRKTVEMPGSWVKDLGAKFQGCVRYQRFFNKPTGISQETPISLAFERVVGYAVVWMNGKQLGRIDWPALRTDMHEKFDIAGQLQSRNEIVVEVTSLPLDVLGDGQEELAGGLVGEVRLEIG